MAPEASEPRAPPWRLPPPAPAQCLGSLHYFSYFIFFDGAAQSHRNWLPLQRSSPSRGIKNAMKSERLLRFLIRSRTFSTVVKLEFFMNRRSHEERREGKSCGLRWYSAILTTASEPASLTRGPMVGDFIPKFKIYKVWWELRSSQIQHSLIFLSSFGRFPF